MELRVVSLALLLLVLSGCRTSDRTIHLPGAVLKTLPEVQVQPPGSMILAFSRDGRWAATAHDLDATIVRVIETDSMRVIAESASPLLPLLFDSDGDVLYCFRDIGVSPVKASGRELVAWHFREGSEVRALGRWDPMKQPVARNHDHTLLVGEGYVLTSRAERVHVPEGEAWFDQFGGLWIKSEAVWTGVTPEGTIRSPGERPSYLTQHPEVERGAMRLFVKETEEFHLDARAGIATIWLVHGKAQPPPDREPRSFYRAAVVFSGLDVFRAEFVPGLNKIHVLTASGSYLVSYAAQPTNR